MADKLPNGTPTRKRCAKCGGSGRTKWWGGSSAHVNHIARGGNPTQLPCGECSGDGFVLERAPRGR